MPLTADRAKPAVPFGGIYRLIDFALSNVVNSGYLQVVVLTQYKSHSLDRHVTQTWRMSTLLGNYVTPVPAQQRVGKHWYLGSADAIFQSLNLISDEKPDIVVVVGADHVYRMDFSQMVDQHVEAARPARSRRSGSRSGWPTSSASSTCTPTTRRGSVSSSRSRRIPLGLPDSPQRGARLDGQLRLRRRRAGRGGHPGRQRWSAPSTTWAATSCRRSCAATRRASTTSRTTTSPAPPTATAATGATSGRSAPTTPRTWTSSRRCRSSTSTTSTGRSTPPTARSRRPSSRRVRTATPRRRWSRCSPRGWWSAAARSRRSVLSPAAFVGSGAEVTDSVLINGVHVGAGAVVRNAILDKNVVVPPGAQIGVDPEADLARGFVVEDGLTVLGKDQVFGTHLRPEQLRQVRSRPAARAGPRRPRPASRRSRAR